MRGDSPARSDLRAANVGTEPDASHELIDEVTGHARPEVGALSFHPAERPRAAETWRVMWSGELEEQCRCSLSDTRARALAQAERCLQAMQDLDEHGIDSWIARAVLHYLAS